MDLSQDLSLSQNLNLSQNLSQNDISSQDDILSRLESLKKSRIKIKVRQTPLSSSIMRESGDFSWANPTDAPKTGESTQKPPTRNKRDGPMFWSTVSGSEKRYSAPEIMGGSDPNRSYFEREDEKLARRDDMRREIAKLLFQENPAPASGGTVDDTSAPLRKEKEKREAPMFWSTAQTYKKKEVKKEEPNIFEEFLLPKGVGKVLEDEEENIRTMEHHVMKEKYKVDIDMEQILQEVADVLTDQKNLIYTNFDIHMEQYKQNYRILREKVTQYKDKAKEFFDSKDSSKNFIAHQQQQQTFNPIMKKVQFYKVNTMTDNSFTKFREETCNVQANASSINREVSKRLIGYLTEELTKQTMHKPLYNHTESLQFMFREVKENIVYKLNECLEDFANSMTYIKAPEVFGNIFAFPQIDSCISEDNLSIIGDSEKLLNMKINLESSVKFEENAKSLCVRAIQGDCAAIGCMDGIVRVWNYSTSALSSFFRAHNSPVSAINVMTIQTGDLNESVILTGGCNPDPTIRAWQIHNQKCVRLLKGHKEDVTCLLPLRDGLTLLSASKENQIFVWNMQTGKLFNKLSQHTKQVNALHIVKDNSRFVSVSSDQTMCVWKVSYEYASQFKRRVLFSCELDKVFEDCCEITTVNSATDNCNIIITAGLDNKIKLWDIAQDACLKSIDGHSMGIAELIYFENPFKIESYEQFMILSLGYNEDSLMVSRSTNTSAVPLTTDYRICLDSELPTNFKMQLVRCSRDNGLKIIMISQGDNSNLLVWNLPSQSE